MFERFFSEKSGTEPGVTYHRKGSSAFSCARCVSDLEGGFCERTLSSTSASEYVVVYRIGEDDRKINS